MSADGSKANLTQRENVVLSNLCVNMYRLEMVDFYSREKMIEVG